VLVCIVEMHSDTNTRSTEVETVEIDRILWCSENQKRLYPQRSRFCARSLAERRDSPGVEPSETEACSSTDSATSDGMWCGPSRTVMFDVRRTSNYDGTLGCLHTQTPRRTPANTRPGQSGGG